MDQDTTKIFRLAFEACLAKLSGEKLEQVDDYLSYDLEQIDTVQWRILGNEMVKDELCELINRLNYCMGPC
jgi:hypothetical protein